MTASSAPRSASSSMFAGNGIKTNAMRWGPSAFNRLCAIYTAVRACVPIALGVWLAHAGTTAHHISRKKHPLASATQSFKLRRQGFSRLCPTCALLVGRRSASRHALLARGNVNILYTLNTSNHEETKRCQKQ